MESIKLEEKYIYEYIKTILNDIKIKSQEVSNARYHHGTNYKYVVPILKHGILPVDELNKLKLHKFNAEFLKVADDSDSHINGIHSVSLSVPNLPDLDPKKFVYNTFDPWYADISVTSDLKAFRTTTNYDNEFLSKEKITVDKLKAIDIRLLKLIEKKSYYNITNEEIIERYHYLKEIALAIKTGKLDIPFREMSNENITLDIDKAAKLPKLILK